MSYCQPKLRIAYHSSVAMTFTLRIVTLGAVTEIEPVTTLFS